MPFGFIGLDASKVAQFLVNCLAVGGGFLAGFLLTWLVTNLLDRWLTGGRTPHPLHRTARILGGLAVAVLVALIVFGQGGDGYGIGGGLGEGKGQGTGEGKGGDATKPTQPISADVKPAESKADAVPKDQRLQVTVLGGETVTEQRFFQLEGEAAALDYAGLKAAAAKRQQSQGKPVAIEVRYAAGAGPDTPGTRLLLRHATNDGLTIILPGGPK
jgi:hypothetical protein